MAKSKSLPEFAKRLTTYSELARYARAFADGHFALLIVLGDPGLGKSYCLRLVLGGRAWWIEGNR